MKKQLLALLAVAVVATSANAAGKIGDIDVSGYVDVYSAAADSSRSACCTAIAVSDSNAVCAGRKIA